MFFGHGPRQPTRPVPVRRLLRLARNQVASIVPAERETTYQVTLATVQVLWPFCRASSIMVATAVRVLSMSAI